MECTLNETSCCGMKEIFELEYFEDTPLFFNELANDLTGIKTAHIIFTDARLPGSKAITNGEKLMKAIRRRRLGKVTVSPWRKNPNSPNEVCVFVWTFNNKMTMMVEKEANR